MHKAGCQGPQLFTSAQYTRTPSFTSSSFLITILKMAWVLQYVCASCHAHIRKRGGYCYQCGHFNPPAPEMDEQGRIPLTPLIGASHASLPFYTGQGQINYTQPFYNETSERYEYADDSRRTSAFDPQPQLAPMQQASEIPYGSAPQGPAPQEEDIDPEFERERAPSPERHTSTSLPQRKSSGLSLRGRASLVSFGRRPMDSGAARQARCEKALAAVNARWANEKKSSSQANTDSASTGEWNTQRRLGFSRPVKRHR